MPTRESKADFDKLVSKYDPAGRTLATRARVLVLKVFPDAHEKTYFGWGNTWYGTSEKNADAVFSISPMKGYVGLYFIKGSELADPDGLLEGTGKKMRHVNIRDRTELGRPALVRLMRRAVAHGGKSRGDADHKSKRPAQPGAKKK